MSSTPIADMVGRLIAAGTPPELAATVVAEAFAAGAALRNSGGIPVDESAERRRAYDRERKRKSAEIRRNSTETPQNSKTALNLTSSSSQDSGLSKEGKKVRARKHPLPPEWQPKPEHFEAGTKRNYPRAAVLEKAEDMRIWAGSTGALKLDWDLTFHGFLRRDAPKFAVNGAHAPRPGSKEDTRERTVNTLRRLHAFAQADDEAGSREADQPVSGLLPFAKPA